MPRISPRALRQAHAIDKRLASLLPVCRDIQSASNELRWLQQHALSHIARDPTKSKQRQHDLSQDYFKRRARGEPLQYILGTEFFGELEIQCRPGVLIPRQETAASIKSLVNRLTMPRKYTAGLRVLDLCTGTGCIPLLFHHEFYSKVPSSSIDLQLLGVDISSAALTLSRHNLDIQRKTQKDVYSEHPQRKASLHNMQFVKADVRAHDGKRQGSGAKPVLEALQELYPHAPTPNCDILISNPPYISSKAFRTTTARSVRHYEPKLALVPQTDGQKDPSLDGDVFYPRLLSLARQVEAKVVLLEVADLEQAKRVALMCLRQGLWDGIEIWRDDPDVRTAEISQVVVDGTPVDVRGRGNGRSVFAYRGSAVSWLADHEGRERTIVS